MRKSIHDATPDQKKKQAALENELRKLMPLVKNFECMNLLSQVLMKECKKFLEESKDKLGGNPIFIQSKLSVMQTAETFEQLYNILSVVK